MMPCYFIMGLGRSGFSAAHWLEKQGYDLVAWDDNTTLREKAQAHSIKVVDPFEADFPWDRVSTLILSPGIPMSLPSPHPVVTMAQEKVTSLEIINDMELFSRHKRRETPIIGITGTNGKSTTTAWLGEIFRSSGKKVGVAGNIGIPVFDFDPSSFMDGFVWEISSYQLENMPSFHPRIAVITNFTPDHLDRYKSEIEYYKTKEKILQKMTQDDWLVIGIDSEPTLRLFNQLKSMGKCGLFPVSVTDVTSPYVREHGMGIYKEHQRIKMVFSSRMIPNEKKSETTLWDLFSLGDHPRLKGVHNDENRACAFGAAFLFGVPLDDIEMGIKKFQGLPHRSEYIAQIRDVLFINDSKATNIEAALKSLNAYDAIYWIAGGVYKGDHIARVLPLLSRVKEVFLIGQSMQIFEDCLASTVSCRRSGTLDRAVREAFNEAQTMGKGKGGTKPVVLLAPGCASFDQFRDFEERGNVFKELVMRIKEETKQKGDR